MFEELPSLRAKRVHIFFGDVMQLEVTFKDICNFIKKDEPTLIEAVDKLIGLTLICSPFMLGPQGLLLLPLLTVKNELTKIGKSVYEIFVKKNDFDIVARQKRMEAAHALIVYTAFFEALDQQLPDGLRKKFASLEANKIPIGTVAELPCSKEPQADDAADSDVNRHLSIRLNFPHPTETLAQQSQRHLRLYQQMAEGFSEGVKRLPVWTEFSEAERKRLSELLLNTPAAAVHHFELMFFELSRRFEDFAVWANLQEHKGTKEIIGSLSEYVQRHIELTKKSGTAIDIGFAKLHNLVLMIPETLKLSQADELVVALRKHYEARMNEPIIENKEELDTDGPRLSFPNVSDAFIPQAFFVLRQTTKARRLEDEETWKGLNRRNDLGTFLVSYLSSPFSTAAPLLILGHPGSGKSLLTTMLAARLMSDHFTVLKVPLREVDSDAGVVSQIEEQISRITKRRSDPWATLSTAFKNNPPLVILDGYDELLQASGRVFAGYLRDVQNFQRSEAEQGRPARVIVTSRITLIDKATIPQGATVIRLLEFDKRQRDRWISVWNKTNKDYFEQCDIRPFELPEDGADFTKVLLLAEQPLLLLMLALYDSERNQLRNSKALDRTALYESLLRRFIQREREKEPTFIDLEKNEKERVLDIEMQRLGVAAIGMYNRRKLHILSAEVNEDLRFFNLERSTKVVDGRPLSQADLLLGSFFFVHRSKTIHKGTTQDSEEISAFEFLHNTFGEFLTADFIIRQAFSEVQLFKALKENEVLRTQLEQKLISADGLSRAWFACFIYTPLYTRPVVLQMIREWIGHTIKRTGMPQNQFLGHLDDIVRNQTRRILTRREMPSLMVEGAQEGYRAAFGAHPLLGHMAIYSVNLILLRIVVSRDPFIFDETQIDSHEDGSRPWDKLTHIWRSWFAMDNLNGITAILSTVRDKHTVKLSSKETLRVSESDSRLDTFWNISVALSDNISGGLAGLLLYDPKKGRSHLQDISSRLSAENIDLAEHIAVEQLATSAREFENSDSDQFFETAGLVLERLLFNPNSRYWDNTILYIRRLLRHGGLAINISKRSPHIARNTDAVLRRLLHPSVLVRLAEHNPYALSELIKLWRDVGGGTWMQRVRIELLDRFFHFTNWRELAENPWVAVDFIELIRVISATSFPLRLPEPFLERLFNPKYMREIAHRSPFVALSLLELAADMFGEGWEHRLGEELLDILNVDQVGELIESNPQLGLKWAKMVRRIARKEEWYEMFNKKLLERILRPSRLQEMLELNPEIALGWLQIGREVRGDRWLRHHSGEVFESLFHPRKILELAEAQPELVVRLLQVAEKIIGADWITDFRSDALGEIFSPSFLRYLLQRAPEIFIDGIRFLKMINSVDYTSIIMQTLKPILYERANPDAALRELPLAVLPEIRRLAQLTGDKALEGILLALDK